MEKVVAAERAKSLLLQELAHRTKNNLAMLSAMTRLQAKAIPESAAALEAVSQRIQLMAEVYDHLMLRNETKLVDLRDYLGQICLRLSATISGTSPVAIRCNVAEVYVHSETAVPLAIIMNELVTNSLKYGFPDGRAGSIEVNLHTDSELILSVSDNGVGYTPSQAKEGIGSRIIALLAQQLGGHLEYEPRAQGARVAMRMAKPAL